MLPRRHLLSLACPAAAIPAAPKRTSARAVAQPLRELRVAVASIAAEGRFEALARCVGETSGGEFRLAPCDGTARRSEPAAVLGGLAFGRASLGAPLEPFAGFPFGMGPREVADWLSSRDGTALWSGAFSLRRMRAFPCAVAVFPGRLLSARAIGSPADLSGLTVACRSDGVLGSGLRDLGAVPVATAAEALFPTTGCPGSERAVVALGLRRGCTADRRARSYRLCPAFGAVVELALPEAGLDALGARFLAVLEQACAAEFGLSLAGLDSAAAEQHPGLPPVSMAVAERVAARTATRLRECFARPEAVALRVAERFAAARLAGLRCDAWG